jgi:uncharacterized membrane protein HdeD (DUF308 family)
LVTFTVMESLHSARVLGTAPPLAALAPLVVIAVAFVVFCVIDLARASSVRYLPKWLWALICVASIPVGGIVYLLVGRDDRR